MESLPKLTGKPISGRTWKDAAQRCTSRIAVRALHSGYNKRKVAAVESNSTKAFEKELKQQKLDEKLARIEARKENEKRRQINEAKAEVVQVITNSRKIKRLNKKKLRNIQKR